MTSKEFIDKREAELIGFIELSLVKPLTETEANFIKYAHAFGIQTALLSKTEVTEMESV